MRPETWALIIPVILVMAAFLLTDAGQSVIVSFTTGIPRGGAFILAGIVVMLIVSGLFYLVIVVGIAGLITGGKGDE
jgi:hypothetical protein